jgi:hypothetical protein
LQEWAETTRKPQATKPYDGMAQRREYNRMHTPLWQNQFFLCNITL